MAHLRLLRFALLPFVTLIASFVFAHGEAFAAGGSISSGQNVRGTISAGSIDSWTFNAITGQQIWVTASEVGTNSGIVPRVDVFGPGGTDLIANGNDVFAEVFFTAPSNGTYMILVHQNFQSDLTGNYVLTLAQGGASFTVPAGDEGGPISSGQNKTGTLFRGDLDEWSFSAVTGRYTNP